MKQCVILFGSTGDLAKKKLLPSLFMLVRKNEFEGPIICVGRREITKDEYVQLMDLESFKKKHLASYETFIKQLYYVKSDLEVKNAASFKKEIEAINTSHKVSSTIAYFALSSELFEPTLKMLKAAKLITPQFKVAFEKPFGDDRSSGLALIKQIKKYASEENTFRVDHYLGKSMLDNILSLRYYNPLFEQLWNAESVESVQITLVEDFGIQDRGSFYDKTGAVRDVVQNHMLQMAALVAMDIPKELTASMIQDEKIKVLRAFKAPSKERIVRAQYENYTKEKDILPTSQTETFAAFEAACSTMRWGGTPFYFKTGKFLDKKNSEINLVLKKNTHQESNVISIRLGPEQEGIAISALAKDHSQKNPHPITFEYCYKCEVGPNTPEAYERLFMDMFAHDKTLFISADEVDASWRFTDLLRAAAAKTPLYSYARRSYGPKEAFDLLKENNHSWANVDRKITL